MANARCRYGPLPCKLPAVLDVFIVSEDRQSSCIVIRDIANGFVMSAVRLMLVASLLLRLAHSETCEPLSDPICFQELPQLAHNWTSFSLTNDSQTTTDVRNRLDEWARLSAISSCWSHASGFLCDLYKPECDSQTGHIRLPCKERCVEMKKYCDDVVERHESWPSFTDCSLFPTCDNASASTVSKQVSLDKRSNNRDLRVVDKLIVVSWENSC
jgi:hypothetical protein